MSRVTKHIRSLSRPSKASEAGRPQPLQSDQMTDRISNKLLAQRLRNRIMEVLSIYYCDEDWASLGPDEVINQWEDFVDQQRFAIFIEPVFTTEEQTQLKAFHAEWLQYCDTTPKSMPSFEVIRATLEWQQLKRHAGELLHLFKQRGKLSEDVEIPLS